MGFWGEKGKSNFDLFVSYRLSKKVPIEVWGTMSAFACVPYDVESPHLDSTTTIVCPPGMLYNGGTSKIKQADWLDMQIIFHQEMLRLSFKASQQPGNTILTCVDRMPSPLPTEVATRIDAQLLFGNDTIAIPVLMPNETTHKLTDVAILSNQKRSPYEFNSNWGT